MERIDVAVIGGGVTGLASARAIAARGLSTCVLERHPRPGLDTSTRNSGVIHAGIYYPTGSLKARLCVEGRRLLYEFCAAHAVPHAKTGKIIVANDTHELASLEGLLAKGTSNGVEGLANGRRRVRRRARAAGACDGRPLLSGERHRRRRGTGEDAPSHRRDRWHHLPARDRNCWAPRGGNDGVELRTERETIVASQVVNAAGLYADEVSLMVGGEQFTIYPCRGEYAEFIPAKRSLVNSLVYPPPLASGHGLGVHLLKTVDGSVWLGPTAKFQARKDDYDSDRLPVDAFVEPARRLLKNVDGRRPAHRRQRYPPQAAPARAVLRRFLDSAGSREPARRPRRRDRIPGLTSCLAVGELVAQIVAEGR